MGSSVGLKQETGLMVDLVADTHFIFVMDEEVQ